MEPRNPFDLTSWFSDGLNGKNPANDADSTDVRFQKLLNALRFFKYMPAWRIKSQTFAERIERKKALEAVRIFEARHGMTL